jgi:predicted dehydrogenase
MIRYGIVGCGSMGREHILNIQALSSGSAARVSRRWPTRMGSRLKAALALFDAGAAPQVFDDHRALRDSGLCDAVVVAAPNFTHAELMRDAAPGAAAPAAGKAPGHAAAGRSRAAGPGARPPASGLGGAGVPLHAAGGGDDPHGP